jgi:hypothetical protein
MEDLEVEAEKQRFISLHFIHPNGSEWFNLNDDFLKKMYDYRIRTEFGGNKEIHNIIEYEHM